MRPSSSALGACIWILIAASFLIFTLHYFVRRTTTRKTLTLSLPIAHDLEGHAITDLMQQNNNHRLKSNEANPPLNVARRKLAMEMNLVGKYYDLYPSEMLIAMQGTFAGRSSRFSKDADGGCITEIVMNYDTSRAILSGVAYCNDMLVERKLSDSISHFTSKESNLHEPQFNVTKSQFSALSIEDLPEGFTVLKASDPRAIRTVTNVQKINPGILVSCIKNLCRSSLISHIINIINALF